MWRWSASFVVGSCALLCLPRLPQLSALAIACTTCVVLGGVLRHVWVTALGIGAAWCALHLQLALDDRLDAALENEPLQIQGTVASVPQGGLDALRFRLEPAALTRPALPSMLELTWYDAPTQVTPQ